ncbi:glycosyltransferase [Litorivicinus sp.]|nr:glycosyltransferase [Litorivicinus sp.]
MKKGVSIIIRTKNEEKWIGLCIRNILKQVYKGPIEIILIDNNSRDKTLEKAISINQRLTITNIDEFKPGKAINMGVARAAHELIVCISSHCVPADEAWLSNLVAPLEKNEKIGAVYGRQIPLGSTPAKDKRDLWNTFGLDRRLQEKDPFFHNANSAFKKNLWQKIQFNEQIQHIEDRIWASQVLATGYLIQYEPEAVVYHHHGIHHNDSKERSEGVCEVMEDLHVGNPNYFNFRELSQDVTVAMMIPFSPRYELIEDKVLQKFLSQITKIQTDQVQLFGLSSGPKDKKVFDSFGIDVPYTRNYESSQDVKPLYKDLKIAVERLEANGQFFDLIGVTDFRNFWLTSQKFEHLKQHWWDADADTLITGHYERFGVSPQATISNESSNTLLIKAGKHWFEQNQAQVKPVFIADPMKLTLTRPEFIRQGRLIGNRVAAYDVLDIER